MENVPPIRQAWRGCRASVLWLPLALSHATMQTTAPNASESDQKAFRHEVQVEAMLTRASHPQRQGGPCVT